MCISAKTVGESASESASARRRTPLEQAHPGASMRRPAAEATAQSGHPRATAQSRSMLQEVFKFYRTSHVHGMEFVPITGW